jgi:hypothetical protein
MSFLDRFDSIFNLVLHSVLDSCATDEFKVFLNMVVNLLQNSLSVVNIFSLLLHQLLESIINHRIELSPSIDQSSKTILGISINLLFSEFKHRFTLSLVQTGEDGLISPLVVDEDIV